MKFARNVDYSKSATHKCVDYPPHLPVFNCYSCTLQKQSTQYRISTTSVMTKQYCQ